MNVFKRLFYLLLLVVSVQAIAQQKKNRIEPGRMYEAGETLYSPRYGFIAKVPEGWEGVLPRESEVFLLTTTTATYGEIFVFGREHGDLNALRDSWMKGVDLSETIRLTAIKPTIEKGLLFSEIKAEGDYVNRGMRGFVIARCSPSGPCITTLMTAPDQYYEAVKNTVTGFMKNSTFEPPSTASPYADFDWQEFLSNKVLATYSSAQGGSKETMLHLCKDGSFTASIKKKGFFKEQNPSYKGNLTGQWSAKGDGEKATLQFIFTNKSLSPVEISLTIKDEKVMYNGERYFVGKSDKCQ